MTCENVKNSGQNTVHTRFTGIPVDWNTVLTGSTVTPDGFFAIKSGVSSRLFECLHCRVSHPASSVSYIRNTMQKNIKKNSEDAVETLLSPAAMD